LVGSEAVARQSGGMLLKLEVFVQRESLIPDHLVDRAHGENGVMVIRTRGEMIVYSLVRAGRDKVVRAGCAVSSAVRSGTPASADHCLNRFSWLCMRE